LPSFELLTSKLGNWFSTYLIKPKLLDFGGVVITTSHYNEILENKKLQGWNHVYQNINYFDMVMTILGEGCSIRYTWIY
jgi:hypothetical protein